MDAHWNCAGLSGITILQDFLRYDDGIKVIFVTACFEEILIDRIKEAGAKGYFYRNINNIKDVATCITNVYNGQHYFISKPLIF